MQNKILIIGNGFDLYHGLPTGYRDFLFFAKNWRAFKKEYDKQDKVGEGCEGNAIKVRLGERNELTKESLLDFASNAGLYSEGHIEGAKKVLKRSQKGADYFRRI